MTVEEFMSYLPHGSGFDCDWEHIRSCKNGTQVFVTYFHNMNMHGYYDGFTRIRLEVPRGALANMRVRLSEGKPIYMDSLSREYYADTIYHSLADNAITYNFDPAQCSDWEPFE
jgi:hypothetical protein